ncbi:laminin domain protein, putative [Rhizoctonia solani AG-3 Rhs1AP]|uniref:Laminin domain protein, putative n=2 Tax=Rhizoctonia solani AG-3 TaxID=1086053 RepID=A0A0A1UJD7_9AGAM|nr:laminin domain protein, putative [Rhizoctonia solani AG-3 Rhs1AP]KEP49160.1 putative laminin domain protein [Rhizoctonia solani 123E]
MIGIHAVIQAANSVSGVPGMQQPVLLVRLAGHLFDAQMARYQSKHPPIIFPSDAAYIPPVLPVHMVVKLETIFGSPSDDEMTKVQDAVQSYQELRRFPLMFDAHVHMELSQHLFDIQLARHMRHAEEHQESVTSQTTARPEDSIRIARPVIDAYPTTAINANAATNNAGKGASAPSTTQASRLETSAEVHELLERSNQFTGQFNQLLEQPNEVTE